MSLLTYKYKILEALVENLSNAHPQLVSSVSISERLQIGLKDTCQIVKAMNALGIIESDQEGERALITAFGMVCYRDMQLSKAA